MGIIEYCDNINCLNNKKYKCVEQDVDFDENANCISTRYEGNEPGFGTVSHRDTPAEKKQPKITGESKNKWLKYI